jgi:signal transduction histidine kinase/CheY-like chemotaxis protein
MKRRLASKLIWSAILVVACGTVLASAHTILTEQRLLRDQADLLGRSLAQSTAATSVDALHDRDHEALQHSVEALVQSGPGLIFARIEGSDGHVVAAYPPDQAAGDVPGSFYQYSADVTAGAGSGRYRLGRVVLGVTGEHAEALIASRMWEFAVVTVLLVAILGVALAWIVRRIIDRPLVALTEHASAIGEGRFDRALDLGTGDELQELAATLNHTCNKLHAHEEALQGLNDSLREHNTRLSEALVQSREATRLKDEFLSNVSHELRTPLNTIVNVPEVLLGEFPRTSACSACAAVFALGPDDRIDAATACLECGATGALSTEGAIRFVGDPTETARYLRAVHRAGVRLSAVVDDLLDFTCLISGGVVLRLDRVELGGLFAELHEKMAPLCQQHDIELCVSALEPGLAITADRSKLARLLHALVGNAIKFSPQGGRIEMSAEQDDDTCLIRVRDHGIGIPPHLRETIFDSFRQGEGGQTRRFGGTGLGLAIARRLVRLHGGEIWVDSEEGKGSTFHVRLPARRADASALRADARRAARATTDSPDGPGDKTIVVVDDHEDAIEATRLALRHLPYRVFGVVDSRDALPTIRRLSPDLIILDLLMPKVSGVSILRRLRADDATKDLPVLVTSAHGGSKEMVSALGAHWLGKPWTNEDVAVEVVHLIERESMFAPAKESAS